MSKTTILLVRHGESEGNVLGVFTGHSGYPLTEMGHKQAELAADYIEKNYKVDAVYSSDLPRAFQTAEHIACVFALPVVTDCRFREIRAAKWERKAFDILGDLFPEDYAVWVNDTTNARCTGGESVREVADRVVQGIMSVAEAHPGQCVVIVAHATPIRTSLWKIAGGTPELFQKYNFGCNCAVSELTFEDGALSIVSANYTDHLQGCKTQLPSNI